MKKQNKKLKTYKVTLHPNNQPIIFVGEYLGKNKKSVLMACCEENDLNIKDENLRIEELKS